MICDLDLGGSMFSKKISAIGFFAFIGIMVFLTAVFNLFWTGTGGDPTRTAYAPFTNDFNEFKEYAALYIPLISFGATLFAGFVVFLVFNDWKVQHNQNIESKYYNQALESFKNISNSINNIKSLVDESGMDINERADLLANKYIEIRREYLKNLKDMQNQIIFIDLMQENTELENIIFPFIFQAKQRIITLDCDESTLLQMNTDFNLLYNSIRDESYFHGNLIKDNIKTIVNILHSKIKA